MMNLGSILFLDIETAPGVDSYEALEPIMKTHWDQKAERIKSWKSIDDDVDMTSFYNQNAAIYAEFGRIVCISLGYWSESKEASHFRMKSIWDLDEKALLEKFLNILNESFDNPNLHYFCGHNIREFDLPYICRRMMINGLALPTMLDLSDKKPWEVKHVLDTMGMWKFGDYKNYVSLDLLCAIFGIPSPKSQMNGAEVGSAFYQGNIKEITEYCEQDVLSTFRVYLRLQDVNLPQDFAVVSTTEWQENE